MSETATDTTKQKPTLFKSPKERFQANTQFVNEHRALIANPAFQRALDVALLSLQEFIERTTEPQMAGGGFLRLVGARQLAQELKGLAEPPIFVPRTVPKDNLDFKA